MMPSNKRNCQGDVHAYIGGIGARLETRFKPSIKVNLKRTLKGASHDELKNFQ